MTTIAQHLFQRGYLRGFQHGYQRGYQRGCQHATEMIATSMLQHNMNDEAVARHTQLTESQLTALKARLADVQKNADLAISPLQSF